MCLIRSSSEPTVWGSPLVKCTVGGPALLQFSSELICLGFFVGCHTCCGIGGNMSSVPVFCLFTFELINYSTNCWKNSYCPLRTLYLLFFVCFFVLLLLIVVSVYFWHKNVFKPFNKAFNSCSGTLGRFNSRSSASGVWTLGRFYWYCQLAGNWQQIFLGSKRRSASSALKTRRKMRLILF